MTNRNIAFILISIIAVCLIILFAWYFPMSQQQQMLDYNNEWKESKIGFKTYVKCPIDNSTENITIIQVVEESIEDSRVDGGRIKVIFICKCEKHKLTWSQSLI